MARRVRDEHLVVAAPAGVADELGPAVDDEVLDAQPGAELLGERARAALAFALHAVVHLLDERGAAEGRPVTEHPLGDRHDGDRHVGAPPVE